MWIWTYYMDMNCTEKNQIAGLNEFLKQGGDKNHYR